MKRLISACVLLAAVCGLLAGVALATGGKLKCFADNGASCTANGSSATLNSTAAGSDAGVYLSNGKSLTGSSLGGVSFSFSYACARASNCLAGGSPRFSIPIDTNGDGVTDGYAFIDALNRGQMGTSGTVSSTDSSCKVFFQSDAYANCAAFAAANPTYTIGNSLPFVIADQPFVGTISNVTYTK